MVELYSYVGIIGGDGGFGWKEWRGRKGIFFLKMVEGIEGVFFELETGEVEFWKEEGVFSC